MDRKALWQMMFLKSSREDKILNTSNCELITHRGFNVQSSTPRSFQRVEVEETILLGAPLFVGPALDSAWSQRCDDLRRAVDRMRNISSQKASILLRASFSAPCMLYVQGPPCARKLEALARATFGIPSGSKFPNVSIF